VFGDKTITRYSCSNYIRSTKYRTLKIKYFSFEYILWKVDAVARLHDCSTPQPYHNRTTTILDRSDVVSKWRRQSVVRRRRRMCRRSWVWRFEIVWYFYRQFPIPLPRTNPVVRGCVKVVQAYAHIDTLRITQTLWSITNCWTQLSQ